MMTFKCYRTTRGGEQIGHAIRFYAESLKQAIEDAAFILGYDRSATRSEARSEGDPVAR